MRMLDSAEGKYLFWRKTYASSIELWQYNLAEVTRQLLDFACVRSDHPKSDLSNEPLASYSPVKHPLSGLDFQELIRLGL